MSKYQSFEQANNPIPEKQFAWPLYGTGLAFLGKDGKPVKRAVPAYSDDELLMRVDAVSMCFTDVKEITQGQNHPRLTGRNLMENPIVPGHELSMTVVGVGKNLETKYTVGSRYTMQPDINRQIMPNVNNFDTFLICSPCLVHSEIQNMFGLSISSLAKLVHRIQS